MNYRPNKANFSVIPPANFSYLEDFICRCSAPISRNSISFISSIAVGSIINISGKKLDPYLVTFCEEQGITIVWIIMLSLLLYSKFSFINLENFDSRWRIRSIDANIAFRKMASSRRRSTIVSFER